MANARRIHLAIELTPPPDFKGRPQSQDACFHTTRPACAQVRSPRFRMLATCRVSKVDCQRCIDSAFYAERVKNSR